MESNLGPRLRHALPYIIFTAVCFFLLPFAAAAIEMKTAPGSGTLFRAVPIIDCCVCMAVGYFYGRKAKRDPIMPLASGLLFLLCIPVFFNATAWIYVILAGASSFLGECFGALYGGRFGK